MPGIVFFVTAIHGKLVYWTLSRVCPRITTLQQYNKPLLCSRVFETSPNISWSIESAEICQLHIAYCRRGSRDSGQLIMASL